jgi:ribulose-5-phosphate 4-epimerase/fuculose-1-phosphate aldolase
MTIAPISQNGPDLQSATKKAGSSTRPLGDKRAILLAHHGQLVATATIEEAAMLAGFIERAARMQVLAQSIGTIKPIDPACAREAHDYRLKPRAVAAPSTISRAACSSRAATCWSSGPTARHH